MVQSTAITYLQLVQKGHVDACTKLDMSKCYVRFKDIDEIHLPTISNVIASCSLEEFIKLHNSAYHDRRKSKS